MVPSFLRPLPQPLYLQLQVSDACVHAKQNKKNRREIEQQNVKRIIWLAKVRQHVGHLVVFSLVFRNLCHQEVSLIAAEGSNTQYQFKKKKKLYVPIFKWAVCELHWMDSLWNIKKVHNLWMHSSVLTPRSSQVAAFMSKCFSTHQFP